MISQFIGEQNIQTMDYSVIIYLEKSLKAMDSNTQMFLLLLRTILMINQWLHHQECQI